MQAIRKDKKLFIAAAATILLLTPCGLKWLFAADDNAEHPNPPVIGEPTRVSDGDINPDTQALDVGGDATIRESPANLMRVTDHILSGGAIETREGFDWLASQGVTMVVSVDGLPSDPEACATGLRRIHIPIGYEGIPRHAQLALCRAGAEADGKIFVHCHHGIHRGPAAAAIIGRASGQLHQAAAVEVLRRAGTDIQFAGLWRDVAEFRPPDEQEPLPELVAEAERPQLAESMARIGRLFDSAVARVETAADNRQQTLSVKLNDQSSDWVNISEFFRESARFEAVSKRADDLAGRLRDAEAKSRQIHALLQNDDARNSLASIAQLRQMCVNCHTDFRN